jgi:hypothetical protein
MKTEEVWRSSNEEAPLDGTNSGTGLTRYRYMPRCRAATTAIFASRPPIARAKRFRRTEVVS